MVLVQDTRYEISHKPFSIARKSNGADVLVGLDYEHSQWICKVNGAQESTLPVVTDTVVLSVLTIIAQYKAPFMLLLVL